MANVTDQCESLVEYSDRELLFAIHARITKLERVLQGNAKQRDWSNWAPPGSVRRIGVKGLS